MKNGYKLGIRGRFFIAFGVLSALTLVATMISWISYNRLGDELNSLIKGNIQTLSLISELKEEGTKITLLAPTLLAAKDENSREQIWTELTSGIGGMRGLLPKITAITTDLQGQHQSLEQIKSLELTLAELDRYVRQNFEVQRLKVSENQRLRWAGANFLAEIKSVTERAQLYLFSRINEDYPDAWAVQNYSGNDSVSEINADLQRLYRIEADVNLLTNLVDRAGHLPDLNSLIATQLHSEDIIQRIFQDLQKVNPLYGLERLEKSVGNIVSLTRGEGNIFSIRSEERQIIYNGEVLLSQIREELNRLNELIAVQTTQTENAAQSSADNIRETIKKGRVWMLLMVVVSLLFTILTVWLYVGRNMVARITSLDASMRSIANGNLDQQVEVKGSDEIGTMARSLVSFRDQLATLQEELVQAGKLAALGQLSAGIAHEINQPLSAIGHYSHNGIRFLKLGKLEEVEKNLNQISNLKKRAAIIITRLKSLARPQKDNLVAVELKQAVDNVLLMLEGDEVRKLTDIQVTFESQHNQVNADPVQLEQVILNLVTNALDAIKEQPDKQIRIACQRNKDWLAIYVRDNGPGISSELREQIFEPFFTTKRRGQSLGLGLSISYNIINSFGGKLSVDLEAKKGASFCIQLPEFRGSKS
ncbi:two-component system, NtrC family, C4-dicarboxylate transport sensor histidine kinase DctB [Amphritea atlantica]|uniref:C4-dicarboxylate transport sensor protein DctB n=1 Tax=Amphritea atlantica TaxID=355243 RepID=A0A1H9J404_9GAMM|nr:ATP-binding protein [Amphritea atlantica]SEQ81469.1 two-component system, NtrC family, C4-dicarboxylate transport sensor histidine kinase DctB [Amphritea atlantica]